MPTRLYGPLSMSLLQWTRSAQDSAQRMVVVRLVDGANAQSTIAQLERCGLCEITETDHNAVQGLVRARDLLKMTELAGVCAIVDART